MRCFLGCLTWFAVVSAQVSFSTEGKISPASYKVLRIIPQDREQLAFLEQLEHNATDLQINFWKSPIRLGSATDMMVPAIHLKQMQQDLFRQGLSSHVIINDVEK